MTNDITRTGSLFSLGSVDATALPQFLELLRTNAVSPKARHRLRQIFEAWFALCEEAVDGFTDRETLCESIDITRSGLIANLKKLEALGLVVRTERRPDAKRRRVVCYEPSLPVQVIGAAIETPDLFDQQILTVADADTAQLEERDALQELFRHPDSVTCTPSNPEKTTFKGERLTVFTLAPALNVGRQGAVTEKTTRIWRGSRSFEVTVRALTGHRIPNVQDLRPLVVAWTLARDQLPQMEGNVPSHPNFVMSLKTVCRQLGFANPTANHLRQTFNRLRRFKSSEWQLTDDRYNVLKTFRKGGVLERNKYMSFISDLEVVSSVGAHGKTPEVISVMFHPALTPVITDVERSLTLHKEFIQGKYREFDQLIYQWCRVVVQHNHDPMEFALERVHREAHPSIDWIQFRQGLERMVTDSRYEQVNDMGCPMVFIPGYVVAVDFATEKLVASARSDDPHLGTTSKYALARLGRQARARELPAPPASSTNAGDDRAPRSAGTGPLPIGDLLKRLAKD